jgi:hypothetical protein
MRTLSNVIKDVLKYKKEKLRLKSQAYGEVELVGIQSDNKIEVSDYQGTSFMFDEYGRIHPKGKCLLWPETGESWDSYLKTIIDEYYDSMIRIGDVCLVKKDEQSEWRLAIYDGKFDGKYKAKVGVESEIFPYCISYSENASYLGRAMFPDWLIDENEPEIDNQ